MNQQRRLDLIASDISDLQKTQAATAARLGQLKRANLELSHRVLQVRAGPRGGRPVRPASGRVTRPVHSSGQGTGRTVHSVVVVMLELGGSDCHVTCMSVPAVLVGDLLCNRCSHEAVLWPV